jgi:hypothetical protein
MMRTKSDVTPIRFVRRLREWLVRERTYPQAALPRSAGNAALASSKLPASPAVRAVRRRAYRRRPSHSTCGQLFGGGIGYLERTMGEGSSCKRHGLSSASGTYANTCRPVLLWRAKILL